MVDLRSSSSRPHSPKPGDWERCSVPHSRLVELQTKGFLPPAYMVPVRAGLATYNGGEQAESFPCPSMGERVCLVPYLLRGLGFPIHPFLRGLLEFYGLQLHNLTTASILHIAGYVALCELFLGCEAHFELWKRLFCLVPRTQRGHFIKWAEPKYGASPIPDTCPVLQRSHPKTGLQNGFIWRTFPFRTLFGGVFLSSTMLL